MSHFLGQHLSERWFDKGSPDPLRRRVWLAVRYVALVASVIVAGVLFDRSPGGALLVGLGGALAASGLIDLLILPPDERSPRTVALLIGAGAALLLLGGYLLAAS